ncbi:hypothetical protein V7117_27215, partial [Bacillus pseudomycoides]
APVRVGEFGTEDLNVPDQLVITGNILYVSNDDPTNVNSNNIEIYNITNPIAPVRVGEFGTGELNGPSGMAITDTTLYVANSGDNTVVIYNIVNPTAPVRV